MNHTLIKQLLASFLIYKYINIENPSETRLKTFGILIIFLYYLDLSLILCVLNNAETGVTEY